MLQGIHWVGHASFRIEAEIVVYIDPWRVQNLVPADLVLITHGHHDHLSVEDLAKIARPDTVYVVARPYANELSGDVRSMSVGDTLAVRGVTIEAVASYNTNKPNHPKKAGNVGYVLTIGGRRIYHAGDTDVIPEMADIRCDVALLPVGGKYTMDAQEAIEAVKMIRPQVVVPMHWGAIVGSATEPQILADGVPTGVQVVTLTAEG
jgi:L-ascorbate metabolism protein UlaG (beta-lactamase superfamily)